MAYPTGFRGAPPLLPQKQWPHSPTTPDSHCHIPAYQPPIMGCPPRSRAYTPHAGYGARPSSIQPTAERIHTTARPYFSGYAHPNGTTYYLPVNTYSYPTTQSGGVFYSPNVTRSAASAETMPAHDSATVATGSPHSSDGTESPEFGAATCAAPAAGYRSPEHQGATTVDVMEAEQDREALISSASTDSFYSHPTPGAILALPPTLDACTPRYRNERLDVTPYQEKLHTDGDPVVCEVTDLLSTEKAQLAIKQAQRLETTVLFTIEMDLILDGTDLLLDGPVLELLRSSPVDFIVEAYQWAEHKRTAQTLLNIKGQNAV